MAQGPCVVYGGGRIEAADGLCIRSRRFQRVEIFVAPDAKLTFGKKVFLNQGVRIVCTTAVSIGDGCQIGDETVTLDSAFHGAGTGNVKSARVQLEENVWLARVSSFCGV